MPILLVTAVAAERDAALARLGPVTPVPGLPYAAVTAGTPCGQIAPSAGAIQPHDGPAVGAVVAAAGGVGPVAAAVATSRLIAALERAGHPVTLVVSAGIAGGFAGRADVGDVVLASSVAFADLGAATDDGFLTLGGLGLTGGAPLDAPHATPATAALTAAGLAPRTGTVLTLATMTGTDARAAALAAAHPDAVAEAMEGYGVASAAVEHGLPWLELRAVSNLIGRRDRSSWDIPAAFAALATAVTALAEPSPHGGA